MEGTVFAFVSNYGIYFAGIAALISYLSEVYSGLSRTGPATAWSNVKMMARVIVTAISVGLAAFIVSAQYEKKTPIAQAADNIIWTYHDCLDATKDVTNADKSLLATMRPLPLKCLAYAIQKDAPDHAAEAASAALAEDMELGQRLLADTSGDKTAPGIASVLHNSFGINPDTFLGTGYSLPRARENEENGYSNAQFREYLVQNTCAEAMAKCAEQQSFVWTWRLDPKELGDMTVRDLLEKMPPRTDSDGFRQAWHARGDHDTGPWLIRFSKFEVKNYKGTIGRTDAAYVFFSELDQALHVPLEEAVRRSGSKTREIDNATPGMTVFVWVVAPAENGDYTKLATWHNVFELLKNLDVSGPVADRMAKRQPPLARRVQQKAGG